MHSLNSFKVKDIEIKYAIIHGGKKSFVMLPGVSLVSVLTSLKAIEEAYKTFLDEYTIYVFDNCAHVNDKDTIVTQADNDILLFDYLNIKSAYVLATSHGGMKAQIVASKRPDLIKKLILASSCLKTNEKRIEVLKRWEGFALNYEVERINRDFFEKLFTPEFYKKNYEVIKTNFKIGTKDDCLNFAKMLRTMYDVDITSYTKKIVCKTLAIGAENDCIFGQDATLEIASTIPCDYYIYKGYCHAVYDEASDYKNRIREFFKD